MPVFSILGMTGEKSYSLNVKSLAHQLDDSTQVLRRHVELANTLATQLAQFHFQHAKLGEQLWGHAPLVADAVANSASGSSTHGDVQLSKNVLANSGDSLPLQDPCETSHLSKEGVAFLPLPMKPNAGLTSPRSPRSPWSPRIRDFSNRHESNRLPSKSTVNSNRKQFLSEGTDPQSFLTEISDATLPAQLAETGNAEAEHLESSSPRSSNLFSHALSRSSERSPGSLASVAKVLIGRASRLQTDKCITSVPVQITDPEESEPKPYEFEQSETSSNASCESTANGQQSTRPDNIGGTTTRASIRQRVSIMSTSFKLNSGRISHATALEIAGVRLASTSPWVVNPEQSRALERWDMVAMLSLVFVALVTPVQISMSDCVIDCPVLFAVNSVVDLIFLVDLVLQFFLMYPKKTNFGYALEYRHKQIVLNYLQTWFAIDLLSIVPFDLISALSKSGEMSKIKAVKVVRLLRLLKLVRVLKASRLFRRFEVRMSFTYQRLALLKFFIVLAALTHWLACLWALTLTLVDADSGVPRWVDVFEEEETNIETKTKNSMWKLYIACLYFTSYTITSVGYGDIGPVNIVERGVCTLIILVSGISWAMVLGQVCGIVGNMDADEQHFRKIMDELNFMMEDRQLPVPMRRRLRSFFLANKIAQRHRHQRQIVETMSPGLQGEVIMEINKVWLSKVTFLNALLEPTLSDDNGVRFLAADHRRLFLSDVARGLQYMMFAQGEYFGIYQVLYILNQGIVGRRSRVLRAGAVWGTDFLLSDVSLHHSPRSVALTYVAVMTIPRNDFLSILGKYAVDCPEVQRRVRRYVCWLAVQRGIMAEAKIRIAAKKMQKRARTPDAKKAARNHRPIKKQPLEDGRWSEEASQKISQHSQFSI